jgi:hypothetical protein
MRTAVNGCFSHDLMAKSLLSCPTCLSSFRPKKHNQKFCSDKCRIASWAANRFLKVFKAGKANGLRELIKELSKAAER